jgi:hypothetical protein
VADVIHMVLDTEQRAIDKARTPYNIKRAEVEYFSDLPLEVFITLEQVICFKFSTLLQA